MTKGTNYVSNILKNWCVITGSYNMNEQRSDLK